MTEYRCTRNSLYMHNCSGRDNIQARQGHYVMASSPEMARKEMARSFPNDTDGFTIDEAIDEGPEAA